MKQFLLTLMIVLLGSMVMAQVPAKTDTTKVNISINSQDKDLIIKWLDEATILIGKTNAPANEADANRSQLQMIKNLIVEQSKKKGPPEKDKPKN